MDDGFYSQPESGTEVVESDGSEESDVARFRREAAQEKATAREAKIGRARPLDIDFNKPPAPADYVVRDRIERGTVAIGSADTGSLKTWIAQDLAVAMATGRGSWLGHHVDAGTVLYIDEENHSALVHRHLAGLGMTNDAATQLIYFARNGIAVGDDDWNVWLDAQLAEHHPDLVVIDTAMAATAVGDVLSNSDVVKLYGVLKQLAERHGCAILILHHNRKESDRPSAGGQGMMGARQWAGQADTHFTLKLLCRDAASQPDGTRHLSTAVALEWVKLRDDVPEETLRVELTSVKHLDGTITAAKLAATGVVDEAKSAAAALLALAMGALEEHGELKRAALAEALDMESQDGTLNRALRDGLARGLLTQPGYGKYALNADPHDEPGI